MIINRAHGVIKDEQNFFEADRLNLVNIILTKSLKLMHKVEENNIILTSK